MSEKAHSMVVFSGLASLFCEYYGSSFDSLLQLNDDTCKVNV